MAKYPSYHVDVDDVSNYTVEEFEECSTRELLNMRDYLASAVQNSSEYTPEGIRFRDARTRLKSVLGTREHIPNKKEAKELRRLRAKQSY